MCNLPSELFLTAGNFVFYKSIILFYNADCINFYITKIAHDAIYLPVNIAIQYLSVWRPEMGTLTMG